MSNNRVPTETTDSKEQLADKTEKNSDTITENPSLNRVKSDNIRVTRGTIEQRLLQKNKPFLNKDFNYGVMYGTFKTEFDDVKKKIDEMHQNLANNQSLILGKTEELSEEHRAILGILGENRKKLGFLVEKTEDYSANSALPPELTEDLKSKVEAATLSLRQAEIFELAKKNGQTTAKDISTHLGIAENTATEHLRKLEKLGFLIRVNRGVYQAKKPANQTHSESSPEHDPDDSKRQDEV